MKMTKQFILGSTIGVLLSIGLMVAVPVLAYRGNAGARDGQRFAPKFSPENRAEMTQAIENGDYAAWEALMGASGRGGKKLDIITEENFATFAEMHKLMLAGDTAGADALRAQLGLPGHMGLGPKEELPGKGFGTPEQHAQMLQAIQDGDYDAWKVLMEEKPGKGAKMLDVITADTFPTFVEMYQKMQEGDKEGAAALRTQLGIEAPGGMFGEGKGWKHGMFGGKRGGPLMQESETQE